MATNIQFTKPVSFDIKADMRTIKGIVEKKVSSMAAHKTPGKADVTRIYLLEPPDAPIAVFDGVPYDTCIEIILARDVIFNDGSDPELIKLAGFEGDECINVVWISIPSLIWSTLLLSEYLVSDTSFFRNYAHEKLLHLLSREGT